MKLYLIRHGKTAGNLAGRYVGRTDERLCAEGIAKLEGMRPFYAPFHPDILFVSPMLRCRQTAEILFPFVKQIAEPDFRECDFGDFEYKTWRELSQDARYQQWVDSGGRLPFPGGESREMFSRRCRDALLRALDQAEGQNCKKAAFVVHGGTIMSILEAYASPRKNYFDYRVKNGCGYAAVCEKNGKETVIRITSVLPKFGKEEKR